MPYIAQTMRHMIDDQIDDLIAAIRKNSLSTYPGVTNYIFTRILKELYAGNSVYPVRYDSMNTAMGILACCQAEFYRTVAVPYEELKKIENGDV